jgi:hypothetical protein
VEPLTHPDHCTDHPEWNESYYFVFYSKAHNLGGMSRLGFKPNKKEGMTFFFLFLPDGSAAAFNLVQDVENYANPLQVGGVTHRYDKNSIWYYTFQGNMIVVKDPEDLGKIGENPQLIANKVNVEINLKFKAFNSVYEYSENMTNESREIGRKAGDKHWEQIANLTGNIKFNRKNYGIKNIIGQRDHTYGVRDWMGVGSWLYYVVWFNKKLCINPAVLIGDDGHISTGGFLFKDGKNIPLKTIKIVEQCFRKDGVFPISSELEIIDKLGKIHTLKAKVGPIIPVPFLDSEGNQSLLIQSFGDFELDENKGGYGTFETLRKIK